MCLSINEEATQELMQSDVDEIEVYKILYTNDTQYRTLYKGVVVENGKEYFAAVPVEDEYYTGEIHGSGIHFYTKLSMAKHELAWARTLNQYLGVEHFLIKMTVKKEDVVAVGKFDEIAVRRCTYPANIAECIVE